MKRREFMVLVSGCPVWWPRTVLAQPTTDAPIVGLLRLATGSQAELIEALRQGMRDHGLVDGINVRLLDRSAEGNPDRLPHLARELAAAGSRLIVTAGTTLVKAVQTTLPDMPVVMSGSADPVAMEFAQSLARPGGKITDVDPRRGLDRQVHRTSGGALARRQAFAAVLHVPIPATASSGGRSLLPANAEGREFMSARSTRSTRCRTSSSGLPVRLSKACI